MKNLYFDLRMAYTQAFLQLHALSTPVRVWPHWEVGSTKRKHIVCNAQKEDVEEGEVTTLSHVSRRLALGTALIGGAAAAGAKVSPADAADDAQLSLDQPGICFTLITSISNPFFACLLFITQTLLETLFCTVSLLH